MTVLAGQQKAQTKSHAIAPSEVVPNESAPEFLRDWALNGARSGIVAGIVFLGFAMGISAVLHQDLFEPLRLIGAIVLGADALIVQNAYGVWILGLSIHLLLSATFGVAFGLVSGGLSFFERTDGYALVFWGAVYGGLLWVVNYYLIATIYQWPWFVGQTSPFWQGFIGHTFFFGAAFGYLLYRRWQLSHPAESQNE